MKKLLTKILPAMLVFLLAIGGLFACTAAKWEGTTLKNWGEVKTATEGGFVCETENYVYFINGSGTYTSDNSFGVPVKGSLAAVEKSSLGSSEAKPQIVVPKLFVATDFNAGVYIFGDYVYYATPNTDKGASGSVANTVLTFSRTKLDGTATETYFNIEGLATEYRIVNTENGVYIIYYDKTDSDNAKLICYNTATKAQTVIAESATSATESLSSYKFVDNSAIFDATVVFTTKVYTEEYDKDATSRAEAKYNRVYAYKAGEESAKLVLDGGYKADGTTEKEIPETYTLTLVKNGYVFYSVTDGKSYTDDVTYGITVSDLYAKQDATVIVNASYVADTSIINSLDEVYVLSETKVLKTTLTQNTLLTEKVVAVAPDKTISKILFVKGIYLYYYNTSNKLARVNIDVEHESLYEDKDFEEQTVSSGAVSTSWFAPELVTVTENGAEKTYILYTDDSTKGAGYTGIVDIGATVKEEKEDDEVIGYYLDGAKVLRILADSDAGAIVNAEIKEMAADYPKVELDKELSDGTFTMVAAENARKAYDTLKEAGKKSVSSDNLKTLKLYERAIALANEMKGLEDFDKAKTDAARDAFKTAYEKAKSAYTKISKNDMEELSDVLPKNYNWFYQQAKAYFEAK